MRQSHSTSKRKVSILLCLAAFVCVASFPLLASDKGTWERVGRWSVPGGFTCQIEKSSHSAEYRYLMLDSNSKILWNKKLTKSGKRYVMVDAPFGEYFEIDSDGNLRAYDREGYIDTYRRKR